MNNAPKPTAVREYEGDLSKGKNKPPLNEPKPVTPLAPEPPIWLNDEAKACWAEMYGEFAAMQLLYAVDREKFATYCQLCADFRQLTIQISEEGYTKLATSSRGKTYEMTNPKVVMRNSIWPQLKTLGELFGDSPVSRLRAGRAQDKAGKDPLDAFLEGDE